jgi:carbamoyl-phosphate synthase small subunit
MDLVRVVTTQAPYNWEHGSWELEEGFPDPVLNPYSLPLHVVVYDYGVKRNILRMLVDCGCRLQVVPADTPVEEVLSLSPDGVFLSNGPGDPEPCDYAQRSIKRLLEENVPLFGICLGHQLLSLASGARTMKMKFGHHGANHPVQDLESGKVMITSQNHGFAVDDETLPENLKVTHRSLFDHSLQGVERTDCPAFSFQGHPEASPGPHDVAPLFDHFIELIKQQRRDVEERV